MLHDAAASYSKIRSLCYDKHNANALKRERTQKWKHVWVSGEAMDFMMMKMMNYADLRYR